MTSVLVGHGIEIQIDAQNRPNSVDLELCRDCFTIKLRLYPEKDREFQFNPLGTTVTFGDNEVLRAKGLFCSSAGKCSLPSQSQSKKWIAAAPQTVLECLRSESGITEPVSVEPVTRASLKRGVNFCFELFVERRPPSIEEEFILVLRGLTKAGKTLELPAMYFRKGTYR